jgi:D-3-phosphoglycerate dehydrogenase / 2-oxoglutarate reductase
MSGRFVLFVPEPFPESALRVLDERFDVRLGRAGAAFAEDELIKNLADADGIAIYSRDRLTERVLTNAPRLRVIAKGGSKPTSNVDLAAAERLGIRVIWTPGANAVSVAEMTLALILSAVRRLPELSARLRTGDWRSFEMLSPEVAGLTLGLVGFGAIGREVAKRYRSFGGAVMAYDPAFDHSVAEPLGVRAATLDQLFRQSDVISLHCEMNATTANLVGRDRLTMAKRGAVLINTARGGLVDEVAVIEALDSGQLSAACLDVFAEEPLRADSPLLRHPRVLATPHVSAFTHAAIHRESAWALEDAARVLQGMNPLHFST